MICSAWSASMKFGHTTASLLIAKLHASSRQSALAQALQEYGRLVRTIYLCRYVADEELRRRVRRQLNKGESLHALRRDLFFAHQGHVRRRHLDDQVDQALCLTLVTNACVLWTTTYLGDALDALRAEGYRGHRRDRGAPDTRRSMTTSTSTAPTPSTSTPNYAAKATARYASPHNCRTKTTKFVPLLSRPLDDLQPAFDPVAGVPDRAQRAGVALERRRGHVIKHQGAVGQMPGGQGVFDGVLTPQHPVHRRI